MRKIVLPPPQGKIVKNSVFYVFVKLGDLGKTVKGEKMVKTVIF